MIATGPRRKLSIEEGGGLKPYNDITDPRIVKMLAHPLRVRILGMLEGRVASPTELADELGIPLGTVSYHVRTLHRLAMIELVKEARRRGAVEHYYTTVEPARISDEAWAVMPDIVKRATVAARLHSIGSYVNAAAAEGGFDAGDAHMTRTPAVLDQQGWSDIAGELRQLLKRIEQVQTESAERMASGDHGSERPVQVVLMLFDSPDPTTVANSPGSEHEIWRGETAESEQEVPST